MADEHASSRFGQVSVAKAAGATYTPAGLATFLAEAVVRRWAGSAEHPVRVLDPAVGDGELLVQVVAALRRAGAGPIVLVGFDVDAAAVQVARARLSALEDCTVSLTVGDFLAVPATARESVQLVVANPPYVRTQVLGEERAMAVARRHGLRGRLDLYQAFMVSLGDWVVEGGVVGLITPNRFLTVRAGAEVRRHLWQHFSVKHVWDLGDTKLFDAAVLPAVSVLVRQSEPSGDPARMTTVYGVDGEPPGEATWVRDVYEALSEAGVVCLPSGRALAVAQGQVVTSDDGSDVWRLGNDVVDAWLATVDRHTWKTLGEVAPVRVGIKTTADKVFIHDRPADDAIEALELLRPLTTHHIARRFRALPACKQVLYTHEVVDGRRQAVDLSRYPKAAAYLGAHRARLEGRSYVAKAKRQWFEVWVPHDPLVWARPKLVFRDISEEPQFWVDLTGSVVNGDCYWWSAADDLLWLAAAVCNTHFIERFYDLRFNNKLYAGRRRFVSQYVTHFPLPDPSRPVSQHLIALAKRAYAGEDVDVEAAVQQAFGLGV